MPLSTTLRPPAPKVARAHHEKSALFSRFSFVRAFYLVYAATFDAPLVHKLTTKYAVHLTVDVTLVGRTTDDATSDMHFQLQVVDASYVDETAAALIEEHRDQFAKLPSQTDRDAAYLRSMSKPFYFVQKCSGEVVQIFHPRNENVAVLNMKKSFLQTISLKMSVDKQNEHVEEHHGKLVVGRTRRTAGRKKRDFCFGSAENKSSARVAAKAAGDKKQRHQKDNNTN
jgi:hypothetical protein